MVKRGSPKPLLFVRVKPPMPVLIMKEYKIKEKISNIKERHLFKKTQRPYYKKLRKQAREYRPYDDGYMLAMLNTIFESWKSFYENGYCVVAQDWANVSPDTPGYGEWCHDIPTRKEIATHLVELYNKMEDASLDSPNELGISTKELFDYLAKYVHYMWD